MKQFASIFIFSPWQYWLKKKRLQSKKVTCHTHFRKCTIDPIVDEKGACIPVLKGNSEACVISQWKQTPPVPVTLPKRKWMVYWFTLCIMEKTMMQTRVLEIKHLKVFTTNRTWQAILLFACSVRSQNTLRFSLSLYNCTYSHTQMILTINDVLHAERSLLLYGKYSFQWSWIN